MIWQTVLDVIDAVESWIAGQSYWVQVVVLLAVLGPLCYLVAGIIDRVVEAVLARHSQRDLIAAVPGPNPVAPRPAASEFDGTAPSAAARGETEQVSTEDFPAEPYPTGLDAAGLDAPAKDTPAKVTPAKDTAGPDAAAMGTAGLDTSAGFDAVPGATAQPGAEHAKAGQ